MHERMYVYVLLWAFFDWENTIIQSIIIPCSPGEVQLEAEEYAEKSWNGRHDRELIWGIWAFLASLNYLYT